MMRSRSILSIACLMVLFLNLDAQAQSPPASAASPATSSDDEDMATNVQKGKKAAHPDDGSDLGAVTAEALQKKKIYWLCQNRDVVRTLDIRVSDEGGCLTNYSKEGIVRTVSQGQNFGSCVHIFANIRRNLESAGWKCRDISQSRVSSGL